ncbi:MAG TPA: hypothetical protein IAC66_07615 [Candidatus Aphodousia gallistercoris]|nr:hypothetical protein [Candidatus Aphodousia gallistercoris]
MATLQKRIEDLARQIALDQITQDIEAENKFVKKDEIGIDDTVSRLLSLEEKVSRLISVAWVQEKVEPLSLKTVDQSNPNLDAYAVRLNDLEAKVSELIEKTWKQETF